MHCIILYATAIADINAITIIDMKHTTPTKTMPPIAIIEPEKEIYSLLK